MTILAVILVILTSSILSFGCFSIYQYAYEKGIKKGIESKDKVEINKENVNIAKGCADYINYRGGE